MQKEFEAVDISRSALAPRGLSRCAAAARAGLTPSGFDKARRDGKYPAPTLPGGRYDRRLLDEAMDRLSGIRGCEETVTALDAWRKSRGSG